ncbi:TLDc domain-containing protein [Entamoeba marina]
MDLLHHLTEWTNCSSFVPLFDSRYDELTIQTFQRKMYNKQNVVILIQTTDDDMFGTYHAHVTPKSVINRRRLASGWEWEYDEKMFLFSLHNHTNPGHPMKWDQRDSSMCSLSLKQDEEQFEIIYWMCWCIQVLKPLNQPKSFVLDALQKHFEGIESSDVLIGKYGILNSFSVSRIFVLEGRNVK